MYKDIVVGYDGSEFSKAAVAEAAGIAKKNGGKITLVHAVFFDEEEFSAAPIQHEKRLELGRKICYQASKEYSEEYGLEIESLVCEGEPPDVVAAVAAGREMDLIALGTHGRRGIKRLLLGSVTSGVIAKAGCDVLVVKNNPSQSAGSYKSILAAYDGSVCSRKSLSRACELAKGQDAQLTVLYVIPRYEEMVEFFMTDTIKSALYKEAQKIIDGARELSSSAASPLASLIREGQAAETIVETSQTLKNDLIVMGSHGWSGVSKAIIGSTAERVIMKTDCPVLVSR
jgi:nucleotide-binding universal stress UspA family protein